MRKIWLIRRNWAIIAARIFRVSRIFRGIGTLAHSRGLRDDSTHGHRGGRSTYDPAAPRSRGGDHTNSAHRLTIEATVDL